jgi:hypothetical protein
VPDQEAEYNGCPRKDPVGEFRQGNPEEAEDDNSDQASDNCVTNRLSLNQFPAVN